MWVWLEPPKLASVFLSASLEKQKRKRYQLKNPGAMCGGPRQPSKTGGLCAPSKRRYCEAMVSELVRRNLGALTFSAWYNYFEAFSLLLVGWIFRL